MSSHDETVHELPMRWADLDTLNHVNNVVYVDYAAESRAMLVEAGVVGVEEQVSRIAVDFLRPLLLSLRPVRVTSRRHGDELVQEISSGESAVVFARVVTTYGPLASLTRGRSTFEPYPLRIRRSDSGDGGITTTTKIFEYFQEARVLLFTALRRDDAGASRFVVGRVDVTFGAPMRWRPEPYPIRSWINRIGDSSITIEAEIADDVAIHAHATSVLVGYDMANQRSRKLEDAEKVVLSEFIPPAR